jgi:hypothetical protein
MGTRRRTLGRAQAKALLIYPGSSNSRTVKLDFRILLPYDNTLVHSKSAGQLNLLNCQGQYANLNQVKRL